MNKKRILPVWESLFADGEQGKFSVREVEIGVNTDNPHQQLARAELIRKLNEALRSLPRRERNIVNRRFGLHGARECQPKIGRRYGISKQRVNQLEQVALQRLQQYMKNGGRGNET